MLCILLPSFACAEDGWVEADRLPHWNAARYDIASPAYCHGDASWQVKTKYYPDPDNANAMLLDLLILDQQGYKANIRGSGLIMYLPYPQNHDAAMGYDCKIEKLDIGTSLERFDLVDPAIAFQPDAASPHGTYRISWDKMTPKAADWGLIMTKMDWEGNSCHYTVGAGNKKVTVTRQVRDVTISGGEIAGTVQFVRLLYGFEDHQESVGWHTESGSYTFHNVTFPSQVFVQAHAGEDYKITLHASVKGSYYLLCELRDGANLDLVNNDIIYSDIDYSLRILADTTCSMSITGNGKILESNGWLYQEELGGDIHDEAPIFVGLTSKVADMDETTLHTTEDALEDIKVFEGRVVVSYDQVKKSEGFPLIRSSCDYIRSIEDGWCRVIDPQTGKNYTLDNDYIVKSCVPQRAL